MLVTEFWEESYLPYCERHRDACRNRVRLQAGLETTPQRPTSALRHHHAARIHRGQGAAIPFIIDEARQKHTREHIGAVASAMFSEAIGATPVLITLGM
jgi:hypothetical protein